MTYKHIKEMKKILYLLTATSLFLSLFVYCSDDKEKQIPTILAVDKTTFSLDASLSKESFALTSNKDWNLNTEASWLTLSPLSGKAGNQLNVEITVSENTDISSRNATITVTADDKTEKIEVLQSGKEIIQ